MAQRRAIVTEVAATAQSERRACRWLGVSRSGLRYPAQRPVRDQALRQRLRELASAHPRWGWPMLHWRLQQEGVCINHKRLRRLYRLEGLAVRRQRRKRVARPRVTVPIADRAQSAVVDGLRARQRCRWPRVPGLHAGR